MKKFKKIILLILIILIVCYLINFIHNFIVYSKIFDYINAISDTNIYYEKTANDVIKYSKLGNLEKIETIKNNSTYSINWNDYDNNEFLDIYVEEKVVNTRIEKPEKYDLPLIVNKEDTTFTNKLAKSAWAIITTAEIDGKDCYIISVGSDKYFIDKDTGFTLRKDSTLTINDKEETISVHYSNWKINELKDEEMEKPDITNYQVN